MEAGVCNDDGIFYLYEGDVSSEDLFLNIWICGSKGISTYIYGDETEKSGCGKAFMIEIRAFYFTLC